MFTLSPIYKGRQRRWQKYQETEKWTLNWVFQEKHFQWQVTENMTQHGNALRPMTNRARSGACWGLWPDPSLPTGPVHLHPHSLWGSRSSLYSFMTKMRKTEKSTFPSAIPIKSHFILLTLIICLALKQSLQSWACDILIGQTQKHTKSSSW